MPPESSRIQSRRLLRKGLGVVLFLIGFLALVTPFTPGSWLLFVGLGLLGIRLTFWEHLQQRVKERMLRSLIHKQANTAMEKEIGTVSHYFDKIGVAIIDLKAPLAVGDTIKVKRGEQEFEQSVTSMQVEHETVQSGKKGDSVGIKVDQKVKEGATVFKVTGE